MQYAWTARGHDPNDPPVARGIVDDLAAAQRAAAGFVRDGRAFFAMVAECWPGGDAWYGMRNTLGGVTWRCRSQDR